MPQARHLAPSGQLLGARTWIWLLVGIALRVALACHWRTQVAEWEADGFVRAWEAAPWGALNRVRPPLTGWVLHALAGTLGMTSVFGVRLLAVGLSLGGVLVAIWTLSRLTRHLRLPARSPGLAGTWLAGWWAVFPTLASSASRPTADLLVGPLLCLLLGSLLVWSERRSVWSAAWVAVTGAAAVLAGGLIVACVLLVGLMIYLCPLPRVPVALCLLAIVGAALGAAWFVQRGPDPQRPWRPDTAPALSVEALLGEAPPVDDRDVLDADVRARQAIETALRGLREHGPVQVARLYSRRLVLDELGSDRFEDWDVQDHGLSYVPIGLLDVFVRGGLLLFALATLSVVRRSTESALPRAAVATGLALLVPLLVFSATSPLALAPFDLPLLAVAAAGVAAADPQRTGLRWGAFSIGGVLLLLLALSSALSDQPPSDWPRHLTHADRQGSHLVAALADGGPTSAQGHLLAVRLLTDPAAPFLRLPEAARRHALLASHLDADAPEVIGALAAAYAECGDYSAAESLVGTLVDGDGMPTAEGRVLTQWLQQVQRVERSAAHH